MAERQINTSTLPTVTPPWLQQAQQEPQQQGTQQNNAPQQQQQQPQIQQPKVNYTSIAGKLFAKPIGNAIAPYYAAGGGATSIGSAVSASGGTYATGSGLAGTASPINTTAGAAGKGATSGLAGGLKGGIGAGIAGIAGGYLGDKLFGGHGGTGGSIGASIGFAAGGPIGAAIGGLFGGAIGGIFGGSEKRAHVGVMQGGGDRVQANKYQKKFNTALGPVIVTTDNIPGESRNQIGKMFQDSDEQVASLLDEDQLARAKNGVLNADSTSHNTSWGKSGKSERANGVFQQAFMDRYAAAMGGIDSNYQGIFKRVADDKTMGAVMGVMAQLDKDVSSRYGVFQDFVPKEHGDLISDDDPRINKTIIGQARAKGSIPYYTTQKINNPQYDAKIAEQYRQQNEDRQILGWQEYKDLEYQQSGLNRYNWVQVTKYKPVYEDTRSAMGNQALDFLAEKYDLGARPAAPKYREVPEPVRSPTGGGVMSWSTSHVEKQNKELRDSYNKKLGAWEKKVLDAYVDNYSQSQAMHQEDVTRQSVANISGTVGRDNVNANVNASGKAANRRNRLFDNVQRQTVKLNRANQNSSASTNAGGLLQQSEVA